MPHLQLPFFPEGITLINQNIGFIRRDTTITYVHGNLHKAVRAGKVHKPQKKNQSQSKGEGTNKSERSAVDALAPIGMGATDTSGRLLASIFRCGSPTPNFVDCLDVPNGGVLLGLPGLLSMGLLSHTEYFEFPDRFPLPIKGPRQGQLKVLQGGSFFIIYLQVS